MPLEQINDIYSPVDFIISESFLLSFLDDRATYPSIHSNGGISTSISLTSKLSMDLIYNIFYHLLLRILRFETTIQDQNSEFETTRIVWKMRFAFNKVVKNLVQL